MSLQLKNAKQMQLAAEAAKRREEEILRAKAEKQQQLQDHDEHNTVEPSTPADVSKVPESVEQSAVPEKEQTPGVVSAGEDTSTKTASDEVSCSADNSEQVAAEMNTDVASDGKVCDNAESNQKLSETDHQKTEAATTESAVEVQCSESSEKSENLENAASESVVDKEVVPVVVVAASEGEVVMTADATTQPDVSQSGSQDYMAEDKCVSSATETGQEQPPELSTKPEQLITDVDRTKLEIADDVIRSVSDESSDAYTDVLEDETDQLSDALEGPDKTKRKEDIEYVELCDESSSTVEPNANKDDNKEETEKELDSILDDVHLDESEHGNRPRVKLLVFSAGIVLCHY